ncbi:MAG: cysteine-rich CWC family protein [Candidatus Obscuribacterales bacterium]|nr:cysteine-rich CWC family protein [Steroidobacteraceae bacterium]
MTQQNSCPLCGGPNACVLATKGASKQTCWCQQIKISAATIERIPKAQRNVACVCERCALAQRRELPEGR